MQFFRIQYTGEKAMPSTVSFMQSPHVLGVVLTQWFMPGIWYYGLEADSLSPSMYIPWKPRLTLQSKQELKEQEYSSAAVKYGPHSDSRAQAKGHGQLAASSLRHKMETNLSR